VDGRHKRPYTIHGTERFSTSIGLTQVSSRHYREAAAFLPRSVARHSQGGTASGSRHKPRPAARARSSASASTSSSLQRV